MTMKPTTEPSTLTSASFEDLVQEMIIRLGEDPQREGLLRTPERVRKSMQFLTRGYTEDPESLLKAALFTVTYDEMVIVKDVEMFSLCEHHMLPFFGKVHVAYIPNRSEEHTSELQSHQDLHSFPTRRSSDLTYDEMVIVKDVEMFSLCEHHMLPFFGKVHVAYIPN